MEYPTVKKSHQITTAVVDPTPEKFEGVPVTIPVPVPPCRTAAMPFPRPAANIGKAMPLPPKAPAKVLINTVTREALFTRATEEVSVPTPTPREAPLYCPDVVKAMEIPAETTVAREAPKGP
jgi:hypothetical protein